ncbi:hypothetical protein BJY04DRAFT_182190 [Aspergillus karnatakaensis]|uniref:uncharacterized protein n=1 Tax=Aspergillus karnatakaensis TaxID=1810916 RepID=UPI003CCCF88C
MITGTVENGAPRKRTHYLVTVELKKVINAERNRGRGTAPTRISVIMARFIHEEGAIEPRI